MVFFFSGRDQAVHNFSHVIDINTRNMETAVGHFGSEQFGQRFHTALDNFALFFHDQRYRSHPHNHSVAPTVKRQGGLSHIPLRGGRTGGQKGRQNPLGYVIVGNIVRPDNNNAFTAT